MNEAADHELPHLSPAANRLGAVFARPKLLAVVCVVVLAGLGWLYLALLIAGMGDPSAALGPGMGVLDLLPRALDAICRPLFGLVMPHGAGGAAAVALVALMWVAMTLAMMPVSYTHLTLPTNR